MDKERAKEIGLVTIVYIGLAAAALMAVGLCTIGVETCTKGVKTITHGVSKIKRHK